MFNGIWLVASEPLTIQGRDVQVGERFQISRIRSGALLVMGRASIAHPQPSGIILAPAIGETEALRLKESWDARYVGPVPEPQIIDEVATEPEDPPRRRGRPRKTLVTNTIDPPYVTEDHPDADDVSRRHYRRRDLESEP